MIKYKKIIIVPLLLMSLMAVGCSKKEVVDENSTSTEYTDEYTESNEENREDYLFDLSKEYYSQIKEDNSNLVEVVQQYVLDTYNEETSLVEGPIFDEDEEGKFELYLQLNSNPNIKFKVATFYNDEEGFFTELDREIASEIIKNKLEEHLKDLLPSGYKLYVNAEHDRLDTLKMDFNPYDLNKISSEELFKENNFKFDLINIGLYITDFDGDIEKYKELSKELTRICLEFDSYQSAIVFADDLSYLDGRIRYENNYKKGSIVTNSDISNEIAFSTEMHINDMHIYHDNAFAGFMNPLKDSVYGVLYLFINEEETYEKLSKDNSKLDSLIIKNKEYK